VGVADVRDPHRLDAAVATGTTGATPRKSWRRSMRRTVLSATNGSSRNGRISATARAPTMAFSIRSAAPRSSCRWCASLSGWRPWRSPSG
jgi:hypothetical protein